MAGSHAISKLTRTYALLLGKYEFIEREIEHVSGIDNMLREINRIDRDKREMLRQLDHIAATAKLIDPAWQRETVPPIYPRKTDQHSNMIGATTYKVLRDAGAPLRTREISRLVAEKLGVELCERELARLDRPIYAILKKRAGKTIQMSDDRPIRWSVMPRDLVRSSGQHASQAAPARQGAAPQR
jgi:hypothetical protein